jgi:hypothetical protein
MDIPDEEYENVKKAGGCYYDFGKAIYYGTPIPEYHGDLVDKEDILHDIDCDEEMRLGKNIEWIREVIRNAPTVIKATKNTNKEESK